MGTGEWILSCDNEELINENIFSVCFFLIIYKNRHHQKGENRQGGKADERTNQ